jgi:hypothetical protein
MIMSSRLFLCAVIAIAVVVGCSVKVDEDDGVEVTAPGVEVNVDGDGAVDVSAPGVGVQVDAEDGVAVDAPGVEVTVDEQGVAVGGDEDAPAAAEEPAAAESTPEGGA